MLFNLMNTLKEHFCVVISSVAEHQFNTTLFPKIVRRFLKEKKKLFMITLIQKLYKSYLHREMLIDTGSWISAYGFQLSINRGTFSHLCQTEHVLLGEFSFHSPISCALLYLSLNLHENTCIW